jgi:hypothetical protein
MALALLTLAAGAVALWMAFYVSREVRNGRDWPTVPGKILERRVGEPMGTRGRSYLPYVKYAYRVAGRDYVNDQVYLIRRTGGLADKMQELVDGLPDPVPVHYAPDDPQRAYLIANSMGIFWILIAFGAGALLLGALQLLVVATRTGRT